MTDVVRQARIRELENAIAARRGEIRKINENIDILELEKLRISNTRNFFTSSIPHNSYIINLNNVSVNEFQGVTRTKIEGILDEMSDEIASRINDHEENEGKIGQKVSELQGRVSTLRGENDDDITEKAWLEQQNLLQN